MRRGRGMGGWGILGGVERKGDDGLMMFGI